jgi:hypothetical protein
MAMRAVPLHDDDPAWSSSSGGEGHYKDPEWNEEDHDLAKDYYAGLPGNAKAVIDLLIDNPGVQLSADEICVELNLSNRHSVATSLNRTRADGRRLPFYWWEQQRGQPSLYAMKPAVARLFAEARAAV